MRNYIDFLLATFLLSGITVQCNDNTTTGNISKVENESNVNEPNNCECKTYECSCCTYLGAEEISLNGIICIQVGYLPDEYGIEAKITWNGNTIIEEKISVRNPLPICLDIPGTSELVAICVRFYDLDVKDHHFTGCVKIEAELDILRIFEIKIGCFIIPITGPSVYLAL